LEVLDELLFDFIHFVDLQTPLIKLLSQNIDDAVATHAAIDIA
jgi:hypothetical protein